ncbi:head GIN domain-containing protein [Hymenobacter sp. BRD67]|uniref:head GIN domain-containing protein n=1 Tax=Hymenobacter sp. BRD67 TaxID=2675877 RepID=UPI001563A6C2|nr:head GIN domain-containing protein [Hymenobacter sp. BRD67]QKG53385.1 DUF2807 domain-containing protein [Hymenobacter sp. BRD67]
MKKYFLPALLWVLALVPALAQTELSTQVRPLEAFHAINIGTGIELELTAGHPQRVEVSAISAEFREHILTTVTSGVLNIHYDNPDERDNRKLSRINKKLHVAVTADQLTAITAGSGAKVTGTGSFATPDFQLDISSGASFKAALNVAVLIVRQNSGSVVSVSGQAPRFDLNINSGATFDGKELQTNRSQIEAGSGSSATLAVREVLLAEASGGASIRYLGSPKLTKNVSGGGSVSGK